MPRPIVPRNGRFGARARVGGKGRLRWLGTFDTEREAEQAIKRAHEKRARASRTNRDVVPPVEGQVLALAADGPEWLRGMILVAAYTGLRLFEIAALTPADLIAPAGEDGWRIRVRRGKGGWEDELSAVFEPALSVLLERVRVRQAGALLFTTAIGTSVTRQAVAKQFKARAVAVGYDGTFHALRHFHACWLLDQGAGVIDVAAQLRHHDRGEEVQRRYGRHRAKSAALRRIQELG